ncbi:MAG: MaoC family dehydratase [Arenicellales bacterium]|jgi:acyl dehydratase|nr:MaoC family dehydratase [Arenicellales bacterium]
MPRSPVPPSQLGDWIGVETGVSDWITVGQSRIDAFAACTEDFQFIHMDPAQAKEKAGLDGTIAHGFLVLSLLSTFALEAAAPLEKAQVSINYGFEKLRFLNPVESGSRVRSRFVLADAVERNAGQWLLSYDVTVEIEDQPKPAIVARWLALQLLD